MSKKKVSKLFELIVSLPKTIIFNFKVLPFKQAIKLPILVRHNAKIKGSSGRVLINSDIKFGLIKIGFGDISIFDKRFSRTIIDFRGDIVFNGRTNIGHGSKLSVNKGGILTLGNNFRVSAESKIVCSKKITFGDDVLVGWECLIMDTDFHKIYSEDNVQINPDREISIGDKVWLCCKNTILKGSKINSNTIVAANTNVNGTIEERDVIIGGNPVRVLRKNIHWAE